MHLGTFLFLWRHFTDAVSNGDWDQVPLLNGGIVFWGVLGFLIWMLKRHEKHLWYRYCANEVGRDSSVGYSDSLRAGRSGDRVPVGGEFFRICPNQPWDPPRLLYNG